MSEDRDELERLQHRLDAAFAATRPRRGFEDELWKRLQARRPWWQRLVPGAPLAPALAAIAIVVVGGPLLFLALTHARPAGVGERAAAPSQGVLYQTANGPASFGRLPRPTLGAPQPAVGAPAGGQPRSSAAPGSPPLPYFGPAQVVVTATVSPPPALNVYRYAPPSARDSEALVTRAGSAGVTVMTLGSAQSGREPLFVASQPSPDSRATQPPSESEAVQSAQRFLAGNGLLPSWPNRVAVDRSGAFAVVHYVRRFDSPGGQTDQVDDRGSPAGTDVVVRASGAVVQASGPLPLRLDTSGYPAGPAEQVLAAARSPVGSGGPQVTLNRADLVYIAVPDGEIGYFEPAWLLRGGFRQGDAEYEMRVLVPAIDLKQLR